eukprot:10619151-Alexandrium_andersonii.AAC.1
MEAHEEILTDFKYQRSNWRNQPAAMLLIVLNGTVGRALIASCKGGLLDDFAHQGKRVEARFLSPRLQRQWVDTCTHLSTALR